MDLIDLTADLNDFADTAALISHLDLVIAVDTAVAHLGGGAGQAGLADASDESGLALDARSR